MISNLKLPSLVARSFPTNSTFRLLKLTCLLITIVIEFDILEASSRQSIVKVFIPSTKVNVTLPILSSFIVSRGLTAAVITLPPASNNIPVIPLI